MPTIEGLKYLSDGSFYLVRYSFVGGEKQATSTYKLIKKNKELTIYSENDENITENLRRIEIKKKGEVLMWINPSRLGLLYKIQTCLIE
tara:strand:+ start:212 stop:478 length:267 start_codon:yes stop_codon:yes gene_type:complete